MSSETVKVTIELTLTVSAESDGKWEESALIDAITDEVESITYYWNGEDLEFAEQEYEGDVTDIRVTVTDTVPIPA